MAYDGSVRINTTIDTKGFNKGIKSMMGSLGNLATMLGVTFSVAALVNFGKKSVETALSMEAGWKGLEFILKAQGRDIQQAKNFLEEYTADGLVPMMNAQKAYRNLLARGYDTKQLEDMLNVFKDSAVYLRRSQYDIGGAIEATTMGFRTERSILSDAAGIEQNLFKMWQAYAKETGTTVSQMTIAEKRIAEYNGVMREGATYTGAAATYTQTYAGRVAQLTAAMISLKTSVGNMLIPVLNQIVPVLTNVIRKFTQLFNIIGRVLNLLFGTQVGAIDAEPVEDASDAYGELGDNIGGAGKAAKGALASFDKLDVLAQKTGSGGGGGGGGGEVIPIEPPETTPFEESLDELETIAERIRAFLAPIGDAFGRLGEAFGRLGEDIMGVWERFFPDEGQTTTFLTLVRDGLIFVIDLFAKAIEKLAIWIEENPDAFQLLTMLLIGIAVAAMAVYAPTLLIIAALVALLAAIGWVANNWDLVKEKALGFVTAIKEYFTNLWTDIVEIWQGVKDWFNEHVIIPVVDFFKGLWEDVSGFFSDLWNDIVEIWNGAGEWFDENVITPVVDFFEGLWEDVSGFFSDLWNDIVEIWNGAGEWFNTNVIIPITNWFKGIWTDVKEFFTNLWNDIVDVWDGVDEWFNTNVTTPVTNWFKGIWTDVSGFFSNLWNDIVGVWEPVSTWFQTNIIDPLVGAWDTATQSIKSFFINTWTDIKDTVRGLINDVIGFINGMISGAVEGINAIIRAINTLSWDIPWWVPWLGGETFGFNFGYVTAPQIPYLATGAVIPPNSEFLAVLGDQKAGRNLEAPESLIRKIVREEAGNRQGQEITINFAGDLGSLIRVLKPYIDKENKRVGTSLVAGRVA